MSESNETNESNQQTTSGISPAASALSAFSDELANVVQQRRDLSSLSAAPPRQSATGGYCGAKAPRRLCLPLTMWLRR